MKTLWLLVLAAAALCAQSKHSNGPIFPPILGSALPTPSAANTGQVFNVSDFLTTCTGGGGTVTPALCVSTGAAWVPEAGGTGGGGSSAGVTVCADGSGSTTTYTCAGSPAPGSYTQGLVIDLIPQTTNSAAPTANIATLGAKSLLYEDGSAIGSGGLQAGLHYLFAYDTAAGAFRVPVTRLTPGGTACLTFNNGVSPATVDINTACVPQLSGANGWTGSNDFSGATNVILPQATQVVGTAIASASTIAPTSPIVHVTGTATINTMTAPTNYATANRGGSQTLIADAAWNITSAGNFSTAFAAVAGTQYTFAYDNTSGKWSTPPTGSGGGGGVTLNADCTTNALPAMTSSTAGDCAPGGGNKVLWQGYVLTIQGAYQPKWNQTGNSTNCNGTIATGSSVTSSIRFVLTGACTLTDTGGADAQPLTVLICQDATGSRTLAWPANFVSTMTISSTASKCNVQDFVYDSTNSKWYARNAGVTGQ